jgi:hypothetical protein
VKRAAGPIPQIDQRSQFHGRHIEYCSVPPPSLVSPIPRKQAQQGFHLFLDLQNNPAGE